MCRDTQNTEFPDNSNRIQCNNSHLFRFHKTILIGWGMAKLLVQQRTFVKKNNTVCVTKIPYFSPAESFSILVTFVVF